MRLVEHSVNNLTPLKEKVLSTTLYVTSPDMIMLLVGVILVVGVGV
jgi:hypothetical protein